MISRSEIVDAFRFLLGRNPENEAVVDRLTSVATWSELRQIFLESAEYKLKHTTPVVYADFIDSAPNTVDVEISETHFARLIAHVQATWEHLGKQQPHWSVLTNPKFLPDKIEANVVEFYKTGESSVQFFEKAAARAYKSLSPGWTCVELGCGVGRVTSFLAQRFSRVIGYDVSAPHLEIAANYMRENNIGNVSLKQLKSLDDLESLQLFDFFYSVIVLQHNPPPLMYKMLQIILGKIRIGGCAYFQIPVACPGYVFSITEYLASVDQNVGSMEMHILPQVYLFRILHETGFRILDIQRDNWSGPPFHSISVLAEKQR